MHHGWMLAIWARYRPKTCTGSARMVMGSLKIERRKIADQCNNEQNSESGQDKWRCVTIKHAHQVRNERSDARAQQDRYHFD